MCSGHFLGTGYANQYSFDMDVLFGKWKIHISITHIHALNNRYNVKLYFNPNLTLQHAYNFIFRVQTTQPVMYHKPDVPLIPSHLHGAILVR